MDAAALFALLNAALLAGTELVKRALGEAVQDTVKLKLQELSGRLADKESQQRAQAFQRAFDQAVEQAQAEGLLKDLLEHQPFQQTVLEALLDPANPFNFDLQASQWGEKYPDQQQALQDFFLALSFRLGFDPTWRPLLEHYRAVRRDKDVQQALQARNLPASESALVRPLIEKIQVEQHVREMASGSSVVGVQYIQNYVEKLILQLDPKAYFDAGREAGRSEARQAYLRQLYKDCQWLPLLEQETEGGQIFNVPLEDVYISLNTTESAPVEEEQKSRKAGQRKATLPGQEDGEKRPLSALESAAQKKKLALLGDPGGKSTFARHLLAWLAAAELGLRPDSPPGIEAGLLPVFLALRDLAPRLNPQELEKLPLHKKKLALVQAVVKQIEQDLQRPLTAELHDGMCAVLHEALRSGDCLLALDGLDEVPQALRSWVRQAVGALLGQFPVQRVLLTCRVLSYVKEAEQPDFERATLAGFDKDQIQAFAEGWYKAQALRRNWPESAWKVKASDLADAALDEDLQELSSNPMLLTIMAIVHQKNFRLPPEKVKLYQQAVEILLVRWQQLKKGQQVVDDDPALDLLLKNERLLRRIMERLAYEAHLARKGANQMADLPRWRAREVLEEKDYIVNSDLVLHFLDYVDQRSGLLVGRGGEPGKPTSYGFPHRTFQEYLAGCYLVSLDNAEEQIARRASEGDAWSVAVELGAEELFHNGGPSARRNVLRMVSGLLPAGDLDSQPKRRQLLWAGKTAALLQERDLPVAELLRPRLLDVLATHAAGGGLPAVERAEAGRALAALGDRRDEALHCDYMPFCYVPAGEFKVGNESSSGDEKPIHTLDLGAFWIARWPVTQAQYGEFVADGGYGDARNWEIAIRHKRWEKGRVRRTIFTGEGLKDELADRPYAFGGAFGLDNHPVVGVCWYEALAFTCWLERRWKDAGLLPSSGKVTLPTEAQWEKTARGGLRVPQKPIPGGPGVGWQVDEKTLSWQENDADRVYPWGNTFESDWVNTSESGIRSTSAVGAFPGGCSPYGVEELSGNVLEWCSSLYKGYPYRVDDGREKLDDTAPRVVRGGAWLHDEWDARCASRYGDSPVNWYGDFGFRVVVSKH
jgi:formylglycine-generating enzyme required for sulfatase activity